MGVSISGLYEPTAIRLEDLSGSIVAIDAYNMLYQFLTSIRGYDGAALTNSKGQVTSHLQGLFARVCALLQKDIQIAFVFDGTPPQLKQKTLDARKDRKEEAKQKYREALATEHVEDMQKYARQTTVLTKEMAAQAKELLRRFNIPVIEAPSEGEAQAAYMCRQGHVDYVASQDADSLLFGAPQIVRNLSVFGRRKLPRKQQWVVVEPQKILLDQVLKDLGITLEQLICVGMLIGTDYAPGGIKGIGPKNAMKLVKAKASSMDAFAELFAEVGWADAHDVAWQGVFSLFTSIPTTDDYKLEWGAPQYDAIQSYLVDEFEFGKDRIEKTLQTLEKHKQKASQKGLSDFF